MTEKLKKMAEALGIKTEGKTVTQIMKEIDDNWKEDKKSINDKSKQEILKNGEENLSKFIKTFDKPFEIFVDKVGAGTKPESLTVVGYNHLNQNVIVVKSGKPKENGETAYKLFTVSREKIITDEERLLELTTKGKKPTVKKQPTVKKNK